MYKIKSTTPKIALQSAKLAIFVKCNTDLGICDSTFFCRYVLTVYSDNFPWPELFEVTERKGVGK